MGSGVLDHPVIVGALAFSQKAYEKIHSAGGECLSILELVERFPRGSGVKILG